ncbi:MAG TPA: hypothetical protein VIP11_11710, partial [Gemmatimonadaceae bacterium]
MDRRTFAKRIAATVAAAGVGSVVYAIGFEPHWLEIVFRDLPIRGLPRGLDGVRLVQISDLHVGPDVADDYIIQSFERIKALSPDVVVFTGDFIIYSAARGDAQFD